MRGRRAPACPADALAIWVVAAAFAVTMAGTTLPTPLYPIYQQRLGFSTLMSTVIFAAYAGGVIVALVLLGRISDVVGRRRTLLPGLVCAVASGVVFLIADSLALLVFARVLSGISAGIFTGTATATLVDLAGDDGRSRASTLATLANMVGLGMGPVIAGVVAEVAAAPLLVPFALHVLLVVVVTAGTWLYVPETVARSRPRLALPRLRIPSRMVGTFMRSALPGFVGFGVLGLFTAVAPAFLIRLLDRPDPILSGGVVAMVFVASAAGQLLSAKSENALVAGSALLVVGLGVLAAALAMSSLPMLVAAAAIAGAGQGLSFRTGLTLINAEAPADRRAEVASAFFVVMYLAISVPVLGVGFAAGALGLQVAGLAFCAAMAFVALAACVVQLVPRRDDRSTDRLRQSRHPVSVGDGM